MQLAAHFPGEPFLLYFVAVVASASALGRTPGFAVVAGTGIASLLYSYGVIYALPHAIDLHSYGVIYPLPHAIDLLAIVIYAVIAALSVEAFCHLVDSALAERSAAISGRKEVEARLAKVESQLGLTRDSEARFRVSFDHAAVGSSSASRSASHWRDAAAWHFGQCLLRHEL